jgi:hypothetical protein
VRLPVIICGDFNGSPNGQVYRYLISQNFKSAYEEHAKQKQQQHHSSTRWISHRNHRGELVPVDHIFYLNPSMQTSERLPALPDWTNLVYYELSQKLFALYRNNSSALHYSTDPDISPAHGNRDTAQDAADVGLVPHHQQERQQPRLLPLELSTILSRHIRDLFSLFDQDNSNYITLDEFEQALNILGFLGENTPALTREEIKIIVQSADKNQDGLIDYKEFCDRFWLALEMMNPDSLQSVTAVSTSGTKQSAMVLSQRLTYARSAWLSRYNQTGVYHQEKQDGENLLEEMKGKMEGSFKTIDRNGEGELALCLVYLLCLLLSYAMPFPSQISVVARGFPGLTPLRLVN